MSKKMKVYVGFISVLALAMIVGIFISTYNGLKEKPVEGEKNITVEVVFEDETKKSFTYKTEEEYLGEVLVKEGLITDKVNGMFSTVDGVTIDASKQQWWKVSKDGEMLNTGVDTTPIYDGDKFEITFTVGYDGF